MPPRPLALSLFVVVASCQPGAGPQPDLASTAERFFRGVYGCDDTEWSVVASPEVRMSYPIFAERFGTPTLEGLAAVEAFSANFCRHWSDPSITVHEAIEDRDRVVLVWSYSADDRGADSGADVRVSWGGISVFHFDGSGRVSAEFGEESTPGPYARIAGNGDSGQEAR